MNFQISPHKLGNVKIPEHTKSHKSSLISISLVKGFLFEWLSASSIVTGKVIMVVTIK